MYFNANRYAFTPLIDDSDDEEVEEFVASPNLGTVPLLERFFNTEQYKH